MVILAYLEVAGAGSYDPEIPEHIRKTKSATNAIRSQIEFTRVYQGIGTREPQWLDLGVIIPREHVPDTIVLAADLKGIRVFADPKLGSVFFNLLENSIMHGERVTYVTVSSRRSRETLVITGEDDDTGIPADEKEKIFERGFGRNTGHGLFLAREILSLTGNTIRETGVPGNGARFEITVEKDKFRIADSSGVNG